jgi:hypothetical protein
MHKYTYECKFTFLSLLDYSGFYNFLFYHIWVTWPDMVITHSRRWANEGASSRDRDRLLGHEMELTIAQPKSYPSNLPSYCQDEWTEGILTSLA